ncbi:hypothetical protein GCM10011578_015630 [Streptomyces fuscichromogenes]|uniref:Uncharacterized protein n=1 Tax=Streptomyces fuscichromogenes TaxID=1324013 RepID=A0A917X8C4_9ACTN|nr:hypothetical protein GCM10011578_015630 [Streptomyces fuscichromogenes]
MGRKLLSSLFEGRLGAVATIATAAISHATIVQTGCRTTALPIRRNMRKVLLGRKITAARGADPGIGDPDRHASNGPVAWLS